MANPKSARIIEQRAPGGDVVAVNRPGWPPDAGSFQSDDAFAADVMDRLARFQRDGAFDQLVMIAEPVFLRRLWLASDRKLGEAMFGVIDRDMTAMNVDQIAPHFAQVLVL